MSKQLKLPSAAATAELTPGGIRQVKAENRRSDSLYWIALEKIRVMENFNVRVRDDSYLAWVRSIADSIKNDGYNIAYPISVYVAAGTDGDEYCLAQGHTRLEAAKIAASEGADISEIPTIILPKSTTMVDLVVDIKRGNTGRELKPIEIAALVARLDKMEVSEAEISRKLDLDASYVNGLMLLASAPRAVAMMVAKDEISASLAISALRKHGADTAAYLTRARSIAEREGKSKITASHMPGAYAGKVIRKNAPDLARTANDIRHDPGYRHLSSNLRERIEALLQTIQEAEGHDAD